MLVLEELRESEINPYVDNNDLLFNFKCLVDEKNLEKKDRNNFLTEQFKQKLKVVKQLLNNLGFNNFMDIKTELDNDTLRERFFKIRINNMQKL